MAVAGGVARFCGPHMMPEPIRTTGAVRRAAKHFNEARDPPFGAAHSQPPTSQPCRSWTYPWPVPPSHGLLQPPLQARRRTWQPWSCSGGLVVQRRHVELHVKKLFVSQVGETGPLSLPPPVSEL